jgi:ParB family transcriptional regulator, chromosome partitioning protein
MNRRGGLGRGLAALIPPGEDQRATLMDLPIDAVVPNPRQPREVFDEVEIEGLATSIRDMGLLQPIVVRPVDESRYELIAGERRLRASRLAGLETLPAVVRHTEDADLLKEALVENIHRVQLNPLEEAAAYQQLLEEFEFTQEELAAKLGRSRPAIGNALRLLNLPPGVQRRVAAGVLSAGHAKALLAVTDDDAQQKLADRIVAEGLSVRATEELVRLRLLDQEQHETPPPAKRRQKKVSAPGLLELQHDLSDALMARVKITMGARKGKLQVEFGSVDDLERIIGVIARGLENGLPDREIIEPSELEPEPVPAAPETEPQAAHEASEPEGSSHVGGFGDEEGSPHAGGDRDEVGSPHAGDDRDEVGSPEAEGVRHEEGASYAEGVHHEEDGPGRDPGAGPYGGEGDLPRPADGAEGIDALEATDLDGLDLDELEELTRPDL